MNALFGFVYWEAGKGDWITHFGAVTFIMINAMFGGAMPAMLNFPIERPIFMREYSVGTYGTVPYAISKMLIEIPFEFIRALLIILISYWLQALHGNFIILVFICWIMSLCAISIATCVGAAKADVKSV